MASNHVAATPASDKFAGFRRRVGQSDIVVTAIRKLPLFLVRSRRIIVAMKPMLRLLACVLALSLALPPGWCCVVPAPKAKAAATPASAGASCCHSETKPVSSPEKSPAPLPQRKCCCEFNATTPPQTQEVALDRALSVPFTSCVAGLILIPANAVASTAFVYPTPSLQILQCVWRC